MHHCWSLIAAQQLVVILPLFKITLPKNVGVIFTGLMWLAAAEVIPTDPIYDYFFNAGEIEGKSINPNFAEIGLEHHLFLSNYGTLGFVAIFIMPLLYLILWIADKFQD